MQALPPDDLFCRRPHARGGAADTMLSRIIARWGTLQRPALFGCVWMAGLLGVLAWLDDRYGGMFLIPPFAATITILLYLPHASVAQPFAIIVGSVLGAAIGSVASVLLGFGTGVAMAAALVALITLPMLRAYHPPGVALAMYAPLLHCGLWYAIQVVLPFTLVAVASAVVMSRLLRSWPQYPAPLRTDIDRVRM